MNGLLKDTGVFEKNRPCLAVSGGVDSIVLLDVFAKAYEAGLILKPRVFHVNHHIHPESDLWANGVVEKAKQYGLDVCVMDIKVGMIALEENARALRYQAMFSQMTSEDVLVTAHHLEDQKETFLFRALRGTGLKGLVGIRYQHSLYGYPVVRPFYQTPKRVILNYAKTNGLKWVEDPSNQDTQYKRNEIRTALSQIKDTDSFALTHLHLERQSRLLEGFLSEKLAALQIDRHVLRLDLLLAESQDLQLELFHHWVSQFYEGLSYHRTLALLDAMRLAKADRYPQEALGDYHLLRYRDQLAMLKLPKASLEINSSEEWIDLGVFGKIHNPWRDNLQITLLADRKGQYKKRLQDKGIPGWIRGFIPVVNGKLVWASLGEWYPPKDWMVWLSKDTETL